MPTKIKNFYAYQIDLHYLKGRHQVDAVKWDVTIVAQLIDHIYNLSDDQKTQRFHDSWLIYLDHFSNEMNYLFGRFAYAEYGTTGELIHADNLRRRPNPKNLREGETLYTYFLIRKSDGLFLLQSHSKLNRPRVEEYLEQFGEPIIRHSQLTYIQICTLLDSSFFDNIQALNSVNKVSIEVTTAQAAADENAAVQLLQSEADRMDATTVKLDFSAKFRRSGLAGAVPFIRSYKDKPGVTKIVVKGKLAGAEKVIRMDESQEKYKRRVEVDGTGQPTLRSVETVLSQIAQARAPLRREDDDA
ncbi:hypothetical protein QJ48_04200 [Paenibacillus sp. A3]|uniref:hypothetical protein n=1 Tax=Paenibacillus sp. A3 TaxID=1337054 RepID=UPI0006D52C2E|nr:hypothetical protein [Paenibacillus sp. A3]KPV60734.1 hypothetical protein QJ48_04200 [Paenibacillus sp. A3]